MSLLSARNIEVISKFVPFFPDIPLATDSGAGTGSHVEEVSNGKAS
jgi:hypothetical protein